jgi:uncharacterized protein (TIGR02453 family)
MARRYFTPRFFEFLEELSRNNNRDWFQQNKARYEHDVREPMLRIYRNLRFSRDKTPYHTNASAAFGHRDGAHFNSPSFYLSLSEAEAFAGVGVWHPDVETLAKIRDAIVTRPSKWKVAINDRKFRARFEMMGDTLSRPPKGYSPGHPLIEDLKRKDFVGGTEFTQKEVCSAEFIDLFSKACAVSAPFMKFLTEAMGLKW